MRRFRQLAVIELVLLCLATPASAFQPKSVTSFASQHGTGEMPHIDVVRYDTKLSANEGQGYGFCKICGNYGPVDRNHIISQHHARRTGQYELIGNQGNIVKLCRPCHEQTTASMVRKRLEKKEQGAYNNKSVNSPRCSYCGKFGHTVEDCYARMNEAKATKANTTANLNHGVGGYRSSGSNKFNQAKARKGNIASNTNRVGGYRSGSSKNSSGLVCFRCGRPGHGVGNCYAKTDVNGQLLLD